MKPPRRQPNRRQKTAPSTRRRYHLADDDAHAFDYELPDWLVGSD